VALQMKMPTEEQTKQCFFLPPFPFSQAIALVSANSQVVTLFVPM
jgi:hypothetical protein